MAYRTKIPYIVRSMDDAFDGAAKAGCERIADTARVLCPVRTGKLKESIKVVERPAEGGHEYSVETNVFYANWVENGTRRQAPQPFLMPAFAVHRQDVEHGMGLAIKEVVYSNAGYSRGLVPLK